MPMPAGAVNSGSYAQAAPSTSQEGTQKLQPGLSSLFSRFTGRSRSSSSPTQHNKAVGASSTVQREDAQDRLAAILNSAKHHQPSSTLSGKRKKAGANGLSPPVPQFIGAAVTPDGDLQDEGPYAPTSPHIFIELLARSTKGSEAPERLKLVQSLGDSVILFDEIDALQTWLSPPVSALLDASLEPVSVRLAGLKLLCTCIAATESSLHIATRKMAFYNSICRYGVEVKDCTEQELDALTEAMSALCKGGRDVSALDGLVERTCDFAGEKFKRRQSQRDQIRLAYFDQHPAFSRLPAEKDPALADPPLLDPLHASVFVSYPVPSITVSGSTKSPAMTLLTNIHKFGFPLLSQDTVAFATAYLVAEALATSNDLIIGSIIEHMDVISKYGYVPSSQIEGVVFFLARVVATEGSRRVLTFIDDLGQEQSEPMLKPLSSKLSSEAKRVINNLLKSTANQALAQLRQGTRPPSSDDPQRDLNVVIGSLRCLRDAMGEIRTSMKHTSPDTTSTYLDSWPIMLSLGIPYFFNNFWDALEWSSPHVSLEVLRIILDRLIASTSSDPSNEAHEYLAVGYAEWNLILDLLREVLRNVQRFEEEDKVLWLLNLTGARPGHKGGTDLRHETTNQDTKSAVLTICRRVLLFIVHEYLKEEFEGSTDRLFNLLYCLGPNLTDETVVMLLEGYTRENICLPSNPEWLDALNDIVVGFLMTDAGDLYGPDAADLTSSSFELLNTNSQKPIRPQSRLNTLEMVADIYESVRDFPEHRNQLVDRILLPTIQYLVTGHIEVQEAIVLSQLIIKISRDALRQLETPETSDNGLLTLSQLQDMLEHVISPLPAQSPVALSPNGSLPTSPNAQSPSVETNQAVSTSTNTDAALFATVKLIDIFTTALSLGGHSVSMHGRVLFRRLLRLLKQPTVPRKARLALLQFSLRLRATARHRVTFVRDIDISGLAEIVSRVDNAPLRQEESQAESAPVQRVKSDEAGTADRRRGRRTHASSSPERRESRSKSRIRFKDRSTSHGVQVPGDPLWHVPETLPFSAPSQLGEDVIGLVSFDHNVEWKDTDEAVRSESEFESYDAALDARPPGSPVLLPVSEYLAALQEIVNSSTDWDLVAYILCHLPVQLSCKHFFAGPRASRQIKALRSLLVEGFMGHTLAVRTLLPEGSRRSDLPSLAYHTLATLTAYKSLFTKAEQDELVQTFASGLPQREVAKPCIHALAMACHELQPSMTKHLSQILANLHKIMSTARMAVHILELIASIGHLPSLFSSFTIDDYRTVLGIALQYIHLHNDKQGAAQPPTSSDAGAAQQSSKAADINHAFAQYVFHLAYIVIELWYMRMRLNQRRQLAPFIIRKLLQANEIKGQLDEPCEVCIDMLARFSTCDIDPRPKRSGLKETLWEASGGSSSARTWVKGHAVVTVRCLTGSRWADIVVRRPSGVASLLLEVANTTEPVVDTVSAEMLEMILRHRGTEPVGTEPSAGLDDRLSRVNPDGIITLQHVREKLGVSSSRPQTTEDGVPAEDQTTRQVPASNLTPSYFAFQLSAFPEFGNTGPPLLIPEEDKFQRTIRTLDNVPVVDFHKIGVVYIGQDDYTESDILCNTHGSKDYVNFLADLGDIVRLKNNTEYYLGGLDREHDIDGKWAYVWSSSGVQTIYHVTTLMPTSPERDPQCIGKKRHIGNDFVKIIFNDSGRPFQSDMLPGQFNFVDVVIEPQTPAGKSWTAHGMSSNTAFFKVSMQRMPDMPEIGPLGVFKMVSDKSLAKCVRHLALYANIFAQVYLESVGIEGRQGARSKTQYVSNWGRRLQHINQLKERIQQQSLPEGQVPPSPQKLASSRMQTMEELYHSLDLSKWAY